MHSSVTFYMHLAQSKSGFSSLHILHCLIHQYDNLNIARNVQLFQDIVLTLYSNTLFQSLELDSSAKKNFLIPSSG